MTNSSLLTELERDALTELVNIGVGRAAGRLRVMLAQQVVLAVPAIEIVSHQQALKLIRQDSTESLVAVRQDFTGPFSGRAMLIFPYSSGLALVRSVAGADVPETELHAIEDEALAETGNIVLNSCLGSIANMLRQTVSLSLPEVMRGEGVTLLGDGDHSADAFVLILYINFSVEQREIRGYLALLMDISSLVSLKLLVADFIESVLV